ncbi:MAG TPA: hypothetical protein VHL52_08970 [Acidimicrobiia bacterium]|nr:hypothetical protein [Acidimicrobiia bacterium]
MEEWVDAILTLLESDPGRSRQGRDGGDGLETDRVRLYLVTFLVAAARALPVGASDRAESVSEARRLAADAGADGLIRWIDRAVTRRGWRPYANRDQALRRRGFLAGWTLS